MTDRVTDRVCRMTDRVRHSSTLIRTGTRTHNYIMSRYVIEFLTKNDQRDQCTEQSRAQQSTAGQGRAGQCTVEQAPCRPARRQSRHRNRDKNRRAWARMVCTRTFKSSPTSRRRRGLRQPGLQPGLLVQQRAVHRARRRADARTSVRQGTGPARQPLASRDSDVGRAFSVQTFCCLAACHRSS